MFVKNNNKIFSVFIIGVFIALILGFTVKHTVLASEVATDTDAPIVLATDTDSIDNSNYLTTDTNTEIGLLLSIRNILLCIWGTIIVFWAYKRMNAIIHRIGGFRQ